MKYRASCRRLIDSLRHELSNYAHSCDLCNIPCVGCVICRISATMRLPLLALNALRIERKIFLDKVFINEEKLIKLIGKDGIRRKIKEQIRKYKSYAKIKCKCGSLGIIHIPYKHMYYVQKVTKKLFYCRCWLCGAMIKFPASFFNRDPMLSEETVTKHVNSWLEDCLGFIDPES